MFWYWSEQVRPVKIIRNYVLEVVFLDHRVWLCSPVVSLPQYLFKASHQRWWKFFCGRSDQKESNKNKRFYISIRILFELRMQIGRSFIELSANQTLRVMGVQDIKSSISRWKASQRKVINGALISICWNSPRNDIIFSFANRQRRIDVCFVSLYLSSI